MHTFVAIRVSHVARALRCSNAAPVSARSSVSCTASSASDEEPSIR